VKHDVPEYYQNDLRSSDKILNSKLLNAASISYRSETAIVCEKVSASVYKERLAKYTTTKRYLDIGKITFTLNALLSK